MVHAKDPFTAELFIKQRNNQKFATRRNQVRYNNIKAQKKRDAKLPIERILDKNRTILQTILSGRLEITKSKDFLLGSGFNFIYLIIRESRIKNQKQ